MLTDGHHSPAGALAGIAARVRPLLPADRRTALDEAVRRAQAGRVRVLVLGEAKRGKSTLVNTLFGADLLPTGALPLTSAATVVTAGPQTSAEVRYLDGRTSLIRLAEVGGLVSQRGNPDNVKGVDRVLITAPCRHLPEGTEVVDTPGTGSIHDANSAESARAHATVDLAVVVVSADPPVSAAEVALVADVMATASAAALVVNKTDLVDPRDVPEIVEFTRHAVTRVLDVDVPVFPMSLHGGGLSGGVASLIAWLSGRMAEHGHRDVVVATARALRRETAAVLDSLRIEEHLLDQTGHESVATVATLREILRRAETSATSGTDHIRGEARRARRSLDGQHDREVVEALSAARVELGTELPPGPGSPEREERRMRARLNALTADACQEWFTRAGKELDAALRGAAERVSVGLRSDLAEARSAAERTLHMRLSPVDEPPPVPPPRLPRLELGEEIVWRELITTAIERHLPAPVRRRRLHHHLADWAENSVPRPFGRARSRLQDWLEASTRDIERALHAAWQAQLAALQRGIEEATRHWDRTDAEITERRTQLTRRVGTIDGALGDLDDLIGTQHQQWSAR